MHSAVAFALDFAEAALEDALRAAHGLSQPSLAGAAAERARAALARVEAASQSLKILLEACGHLSLTQPHNIHSQSAFLNFSA